jgi:hypothetical protein
MSHLHSGDNGLSVSNSNPLPIKLMTVIPSGQNDIGQVLNAFQNISVITNGSYATNGNSTEIDCSKYKEAIVFIDVTAVSGTTPTLDVKFQTQDPVSLKWFDLTDLTFTQKAGISTEMKTKANLLGSKLRCTYTIGGTASPNFTFSVGMILKN